MLKFIILLLTIHLSLFCSNIENPTLLIKIPTRSRPAQFFKYLDLYYQKLSKEVSYFFLISCDEDDPTMNNPIVINKLNSYQNLYYTFNKSVSKIDAYNRDIDKYINLFDILILTSDDMEPVFNNYDKIIVNYMQKFFPDYDGVLNFFDGNVGKQLNTYPIIGKTFYKRFNYGYYPGYKSFFCDEELTIISRNLNKEIVCNEKLFQHNFMRQPDGLYAKNLTYWSQDKELFHKRKKFNFYVAELENINLQ